MITPSAPAAGTSIWPWSMIVIDSPATRVIEPVTLAMTNAAPLGLLARASQPSSRRSSLVSEAMFA
jgi:hypothetical protein